MKITNDYDFFIQYVNYCKELSKIKIGYFSYSDPVNDNYYKFIRYS